MPFLQLASFVLALTLPFVDIAATAATLPAITIEELCSRSKEYKPPTWEHTQDNLIPTQFGAVKYTASAHLQLVGDGQSEWEEYQEELDDYCKWFKEKEEDLLDRYENARGENKITAAESLVLFIPEAYDRWDLINQPYSGEWQGEYRTRIYMPPPMLELDVTEKGTMNFVVTDRFGERGSGKTVEGDVKDGRLEATIRLSLGGNPGFEFRSQGRFEIAILGTAFGDIAPAVMAHKMLEMEAGVNFGGFIVGYVDYVDGEVTTDVYAIDELRTILLTSDKSYHDFSHDTYVTFHRSQVEGQLDLTERLNRYFRQFVKTIDDIRQSQFGAQPMPKARADIAWSTVERLIGAQRLGEMTNVDIDVIDSTGLMPRVPGSLYDQWYERWFPEVLQYWDERVEKAATPAAKSAATHGRFELLMDAVLWHSEGVVSEVLLKRLEIYRASPLMDRTYKEYFVVTLSLWKSRLHSDPSQLREAESWVTAQADIIPQFVSETLITELGLSAPENLLEALRSITGESP